MNFLKIIFILIVTISEYKLIAQVDSQFNYDPFISFDNYIVDRIINFERHINSPFLLNGQVKSLQIIDSTLESKTSIEYIYDIHKNNIGIANYDKDLIKIGERKFLNKPYYDGYQTISDGYFKLNQNQMETWSSFIDTINKIIIVKTQINDELTSLDSIYYSDHFIPLEITKKEIINGILENYSYRKYEYNRDKITTIINHNIPYNRIWGIRRFYDDLNRPIYQQGINIDRNTFKYTLDTVKSEEFKWIDNDFTYNNGNMNTNYNFKMNKITRNSKDAESIIYLSNSYKPIRIEINYINKYQNKVEIIYKFNEHDDCTDKKYIGRERSRKDEHFEFIYDEKGNWIEKIFYLNGKWYSTMTRKIKYH